MLLVIGRVRCPAEQRDEVIALFRRGLLGLVTEAPEVAIHEVADTKPFRRDAS